MAQKWRWEGESVLQKVCKGAANFYLLEFRVLADCFSSDFFRTDKMSYDCWWLWMLDEIAMLK